MQRLWFRLQNRVLLSQFLHSVEGHSDVSIVWLP